MYLVVKYTCAYKTSDEVFATLRKRGIKPIKVVAADGSKTNGEIRGVRKRVVAGVVLTVALVVGLVAYRGGTRSVASAGAANGLAALPVDGMTRRQVIGDAAVIEKGILTGWSTVFPEEGERFFASFAVPGVKAGQRNTTVEELNAALSRAVPVEDRDGLEARQIKAMVEGMKQEARTYVAAGGTVVEYGRRLTERQDAEIAIYERAKAEIEAAKKTLGEAELIALWEKRNDQLRNLGIKLISLDE